MDCCAAAMAFRASSMFCISAALDHFLQNNHSKARKAIDKALAIDPGNKKAREMLRILGALG